MATKAPDVTTQEIIKLPDSKELQTLPRFAVTAGQLADLNRELATLATEAKGLKIVDKTTFDRMDVINKRRKEIVKAAESLVEPYKSPLRMWMDFVQGHFNVVKNRTEEIKVYMEPAMATYVREDEARRKAEEDRIQREINEQNRKAADEKRQADLKLAEDKRQADLKLAADRKKEQIAQCKADYKSGLLTKRGYTAKMKELGAQSEAAKEQAELDAEAAAKQADLDAEAAKAAPPKVEVKSNVRQGRKTYYAECVDRDLFICGAIKRFNAGDMTMIAYLLPNDTALKDQAGELRDSAKMAAFLPGVKAWDKNSF